MPVFGGGNRMRKAREAPRRSTGRQWHSKRGHSGNAPERVVDLQQMGAVTLRRNMQERVSPGQAARDPAAARGGAGAASRRSLFRLGEGLLQGVG